MRYSIEEIASCPYNMALLQARGYDEVRDKIASDVASTATKALLEQSKGVVLEAIDLTGATNAIKTKAAEVTDRVTDKLINRITKVIEPIFQPLANIQTINNTALSSVFNKNRENDDARTNYRMQEDHLVNDLPELVELDEIDDIVGAINNQPDYKTLLVSTVAEVESTITMQARIAAELLYNAKVANSIQARSFSLINQANAAGSIAFGSSLISELPGFELAAAIATRGFASTISSAAPFIVPIASMGISHHVSTLYNQDIESWNYYVNNATDIEKNITPEAQDYALVNRMGVFDSEDPFDRQALDHLATGAAIRGFWAKADDSLSSVDSKAIARNAYYAAIKTHVKQNEQCAHLNELEDDPFVLHSIDTVTGIFPKSLYQQPYKGTVIHMGVKTYIDAYQKICENTRFKTEHKIINKNNWELGMSFVGGSRLDIYTTNGIKVYDVKTGKQGFGMNQVERIMKNIMRPKPEYGNTIYYIEARPSDEGGLKYVHKQIFDPL